MPSVSLWRWCYHTSYICRRQPNIEFWHGTAVEKLSKFTSKKLHLQNIGNIILKNYDLDTKIDLISSFFLSLEHNLPKVGLETLVSECRNGLPCCQCFVINKCMAIFHLFALDKPPILYVTIRFLLHLIHVPSIAHAKDIMYSTWLILACIQKFWTLLWRGQACFSAVSFSLVFK